LGSGRDAINDKVARLVRLTNEAQYDLFVITDGDVRVRPDYLRSVVVPFSDPKVGAATCLYVSTKKAHSRRAAVHFHDLRFFAGVMTAWQLDSANFTLSQTSSLRVRTSPDWRLSSHRKPAGGRPVHWALGGRTGMEVRLLPYVVQTVADFKSLMICSTSAFAG